MDYTNKQAVLIGSLFRIQGRVSEAASTDRTINRSLRLPFIRRSLVTLRFTLRIVSYLSTDQPSPPSCRRVSGVVSTIVYRSTGHDDTVRLSSSKPILSVESAKRYLSIAYRSTGHDDTVRLSSSKPILSHKQRSGTYPWTIIPQT